jgi:hypothetical protein
LKSFFLKNKELILFLVWGLTAVFFSINHVVWRDEMRALSIAIDSKSLYQLIFEKLHNEGHPILWYVLLYLFYNILNATWTLKFLALLIGFVNSFLILFKTRLPFYIKLLIIFSSFFFFEYTIKSRNYGISITFILLMYLYYIKDYNIKHYALLLLYGIFLSQTNIIGLFISILIILLYIYEKKITPFNSNILAFFILLFIVSLFYYTTKIDLNSAFYYNKQELINKIANFQSISLLVPIFLFKSFVGDMNTIGISICITIVFFILYSLRKSKPKLITIYILLILTEFVTIHIYSLFPRHIGLVLFFYILLYFKDYDKLEKHKQIKKHISTPLVLLLVFFFVNLFQMYENYSTPHSSSERLASFIKSNNYEKMILIGERDFFTEAIPYYSNIKIYMPRENRFSNYTHFTKENKDTLKLSQLYHFSDSIREPILLLFDSLSHYKNKTHRTFYNYRNKVFIFDSKNINRITFLKNFSNAHSDEKYELYILYPKDSLKIISKN